MNRGAVGLHVLAAHFRQEPADYCLLRKVAIVYGVALDRK